MSNKETVPNDEVYNADNASLNSSAQQSIKEVDNTLEEKRAIKDKRISKIDLIKSLKNRQDVNQSHEAIQPH